MRKIGICLGAVRNMPLEERVQRYVSLGFNTTFTGVCDTLSEQTAYAELFAKHGLEYENLHAPFGHINDIWLDCEGGEQMLAELIKSVDHCKAIDARILVVHLSSGITPPSITDIGQTRFKKLMEHAEKNNVTVAYENQRMLGNIAWAFEEFASSPALGFCLDSGHENCFTYGRQYMPLFGKKLVCTHINDNKGPIPTDGQNDLHMLPFDGGVDFDRVARQIREADYKGSLMLEVMKDHSKGFYDGITEDEYLEKAAAGIKQLRTLIDGE